MNFALIFLSITVLSISATPFGQELAAPVKASEFGGKAIETEHGEEDWRKLEEASKAPAGAPAARRQLPASSPHPGWMHLANLRPRPYSTLVLYGLWLYTAPTQPHPTLTLPHSYLSPYSHLNYNKGGLQG